MKKISRIIFKDYNDKNNNQNGIIFFDDGTTNIVSKDELLDYLLEFATQESIDSVNELLYNNENVVAIDSDEDFSSFLTDIDDEFINSLGKKIEEETENSLNNEEDAEKKSESSSEYNDEDFKKHKDDLDEELEDDIISEDDYDEYEDKLLFEKIMGASKKAKIVMGSIFLGTVVAVCSAGMNLIKKSEKNIEKETIAHAKAYQNKFEDMEYDELTDKTIKTAQKKEMSKVGSFIDNYNGKFADKHIENGKDIRAALSWDEVMALDLAYNDFRPNEISEIFNSGLDSVYQINSQNFINNYKSAILQLTAAYVIEDTSSYISLDTLMTDVQHKGFYSKYHELFMKAKSSTGEQQKKYVNDFYTQLAADFPIDGDKIELGMMHSDYSTIESYKLSVIPMVAASEMLFQNLDVDHTLSDKAMEYFNDLGLCNFVEGKYSQYEAIALVTEKSEFSPLYLTFKSKKEEDLINRNQYNLQDSKRDLSKLDKFQNIINGKKETLTPEQIENLGTVEKQNTIQTSPETISKSTSTTKTESSSKTTNDRNEAVQVVGEEEVSHQEQSVNEQISSENAQAELNAQTQAETERQRQQEEANKEKESLEESVSKENENLQDKIETNNEKIDNGETVNEADYGQNESGDNYVDIDDNHSDNQGNIDNSVKDITTDGTGSVDQSESLPTPTEMPEVEYTPETEETTQSYEETTQFYEGFSNEEIANRIVEQMANVEYTTQEPITLQYIK